jgi:hypothetical protein
MKILHLDKINSIKMWICRFIINQTSNLTDNNIEQYTNKNINWLKDKNVCNSWTYKDYNLKLI